MISTNEDRIVYDLHEEIMDEMRGEPVGVQIKTAFAVLASVLVTAGRQDPDGLKRAAIEVQQMLQEK